MKKFLLLTVTLLLASCGTPTPAATSTPIPSLIPTSTPVTIVANTPVPPVATATPVIITGTLKARVNVRSGPGTGYDSLGLLDSGQTVQIFAKDKTGTWYQIAFSPSSSGTGWVAAQYVDTGGQAVPTFTPQVSASGPTGTVSQRLKVRTGPGSNYDSLGILEAGTVVSLMGKNATGSWLQIQYPVGTTGRGWVSVEYVRVESTTGLPILNAAGTPVTPGATTIAEFTPTATVGPALGDMDTAASPVAKVTFKASGTRKFIYTGDVSTPDGDPDDWVEFTAYASGSNAAALIASLSCRGNGKVNIELWQNGQPLSGWGSLACGEIGRSLVVTPGIPYLLRLRAAPGSGLQYINYTITIQTNP